MASSSRSFATPIVRRFHELGLRVLATHFYDCIVDGKIPYTTGQEARQDIAVLQAIARAAMTRTPQALPSGRS